jgi:lipoyl(octanoyl) transferase
MICHVHDLGLMEYQVAWDLQNQLAAEIARGARTPTLLLVEHPHTYTFGRRGRSENLLWDENQLKARGVVVHWVDRGGDVTYHGPGQLVGYPLIPLGQIGVQSLQTLHFRSLETSESRHIPQADYVGYVRKLEQMLIVALGRLGLASGLLNGYTGVWVEGPGRPKPAKIAAIGVKVDAQGVTRHGFALNVNPDMSYFEGIVPCGILEYPSTSLAERLLPLPALAQVKEQVVRAFGEIFGYETVTTSV